MTPLEVARRLAKIEKQYRMLVDEITYLDRALRAEITQTRIEREANKLTPSQIKARTKAALDAREEWLAEHDRPADEI